MAQSVSISGERKQWHKITLDFEGPNRGENEGTFLDHRLDVTFRHAGTGETITVPGFFAADGDAGDTNASSGSVWRAHFNPSRTGEWTWEASFRKGDGVAVAANPKAGSSGGHMDGERGSFSVGASDKGGADLRGKGIIEFDGDQYLSHAGTGETFLKSGVGSPENFLAYSGFDNTPDSHGYAPHVGDWNSGDPTWDGGKGKGIVGAVNYLAEQGVNSAYMLLMNVGGDGRDVWPWSDTDLNKIAKNAGDSEGSRNLVEEARSFDVSKLDQWGRVFDHMEEKGIALHLFLQETENDHLLNDGDMGTERALFLREMVARFAHNNGVIWNLGEETTNTPEQLRAHSKALKALDPYDHPVALHTYPNEHHKYEPLRGEKTIDVLSLQTQNSKAVPDIEEMIAGAEAEGRSVAAFLDEPGTASTGLAAVGDAGWQKNHDELRETLWRSYMDGGSGVEWYFGYQTADREGGDLAMEDFSLREPAYAWSKHAREFFEDLPLGKMSGADGLTSIGGDEVLAQKGEAYAIFLPDGGTTKLDLGGVSGTFDVSWFDPLSGRFRDGTIETVSGGAKVDLGRAPFEAGREWAILVDRDGGSPARPAPTPTPEPRPEAEAQPEFEAEPAPVQAPGGASATLTLFDARSDTALFELAASVVVHRASVEGRDLTVVAEADVGGVESARMTAGGHAKVESVEPYALFGDRGSDLQGGLSLKDATSIGVELFSGDDASGALLGRTTVEIDPDGGVLRGTSGANTFALDEDLVGKDRIKGFSEKDTLLFFGDRLVDAGDVMDRASVRGGDTVIDLGGGKALTLKGYTTLSADDVSVRSGGSAARSEQPETEPAPAPTPTPAPEPEAPAAADQPARLELVDARSDELLFELGRSTVIDAQSVRGMDFSVAAAAAVSGVESARLKLEGGHTVVENVEPYALFGDRGGDFSGGLALDRSTRLEVELFARDDAQGASRGTAVAEIKVADGVLRGTQGADTFAFNETEVTRDVVEGFTEADTLALFGDRFDRASEVMARAAVKGGDTVIELWGGDTLTLRDYATLSADDILV